MCMGFSLVEFMGKGGKHFLRNLMGRYYLFFFSMIQGVDEVVLRTIVPPV